MRMRVESNHKESNILAIIRRRMRFCAILETPAFCDSREAGQRQVCSTMGWEQRGNNRYYYRKESFLQMLGMEELRRRFSEPPLVVRL